MNGHTPDPAVPEAAVRVERDGAVAAVTLTRPEQANAMDGEITVALLETFRSLAGDEEVRALVLTGAGTVFSAGGAVDTIRAMRDDARFRGAVLRAHQELFWTMTRLPFPTVAAVNGPAVGAGSTVALLCDLVVMSPEAYLRDPRVSLGLLDGAGGFVLWPLLTSLSAAKEHLLLGSKVTGIEAHRLGLANRVVPAPEVLAESLRLARSLAALPRAAVQQARRLLNIHIDRAAPMLEECALAEYACFDTPEHYLLLEELSSTLAEPNAKESS
ncbi:enoyl-CoA hydratase/isomerase family protein [Nocardia miyunensis]|uniref:enoyl-CoA hydratase/isomerase family protein n=1 Tax=Nocardia miyunensis TaxID=282684 RepID=UPI000829D2B8|nr:enoyl-CoA hydratase/isomerase family protein [Nocardia miyunensis]